MPSKKDSSSEKKSSKKKASEKKSKNKKNNKKDDSDSKTKEEAFENVVNNAKELAEEYVKKGKEMKAAIEKLNKIHKKEIKLGGKSKKKRDPNAKKFGIAAPAVVPKEISDFLELEDPDELIPRTTITKKIYEYIDEHDLKQKKNKSIINPDKKLMKLFKMEKDEELTIQTFGRFLARCYPKSKKGKKSSDSSKKKSNKSNKSDDDSNKSTSESESSDSDDE